MSVFPSLLLLLTAKLLWGAQRIQVCVGALTVITPVLYPEFPEDNFNPPGEFLHRQHKGIRVIQLLLGTSWVWRQLTAPCTAFPTGKGDINTLKRNPDKEHAAFRRQLHIHITPAAFWPCHHLKGRSDKSHSVLHTQSPCQIPNRSCLHAEQTPHRALPGGN